MNDEARQHADGLLAAIGLSDKFIDELRQADDWTFLIKATTLIEASLTHLIVDDLARPEATNFVQKLQLQQKLKLAKDLDILSEYHNFISYVSRLRNLVAHDIRHTTFSLQAHLQDAKGLGDFKAALPGAPFNDSIDPDKWRTSAKAVLWLVLVGVLANAFAHTQLVDAKRQLAAYQHTKGDLAGRGALGEDLWTRIFG